MQGIKCQNVSRTLCSRCFLWSKMAQNCFYFEIKDWNSDSLSEFIKRMTYILAKTFHKHILIAHEIDFTAICRCFSFGSAFIVSYINCRVSSAERVGEKVFRFFSLNPEHCSQTLFKQWQSYFQPMCSRDRELSTIPSNASTVEAKLMHIYNFSNLHWEQVLREQHGSASSISSPLLTLSWALFVFPTPISKHIVCPLFGHFGLKLHFYHCVTLPFEAGAFHLKGKWLLSLIIGWCLSHIWLTSLITSFINTFLATRHSLHQPRLVKIHFMYQVLQW